MNDLQTLFLCCVAFAILAVVSLVIWAGAKRRNMLLSAENAALRSQISQRDASGRFAKKNAS